MGKPFSPERLANIRRMRKARRLFKKAPLFAYAYMSDDYPDYTYAQFLDDLRIRRPGRKRKTRSPLERYGRYGKMQELRNLYRQTGEIAFALQAQQLKDNMTRPYRLLVRKNDQIREYSLSPLIHYMQIENLSKRVTACRSIAEADKLIADFMERSYIL